MALLARRPLAVLVLMGAASAAGYGAAAFALPVSNRPAHVWAFLTLFGALFGVMAGAVAPARRAFAAAPGPAVRTVLLFALLFRLALAPAGLAHSGPDAWGAGAGGHSQPPLEALADDLAGRRVVFARHLLYDDDLWRYLWDGHVAAAGFDPYAASPRELEGRAEAGDPAAAALLEGEPWWDLLDQVGFPTYRTVYPPGAQLLFLLSHAVAPASVVAWKLLLVAADLGTCWLVLRLLRHLGRLEHHAILYAWNPLPIKELAGSGHVDGVMVLLAVLAVERLLAGRHATALGALGASALTKLGAAVLAPLFVLRTGARSWWALPAAGVVLSLPFVGGLPELARSLAVYGREWSFNAGPWGLAVWTAGALGAERPEAWAHALTGAAAATVVGVSAWWSRGSDRRFVESAFFALAATVWLAPAVMPWYLLWALPFAVAAGRRSWVLLSALSLLSYLVYAHHAERGWWLWLEHGAFAAAFGWEAWRRR